MTHNQQPSIRNDTVPPSSVKAPSRKDSTQMTVTPTYDNTSTNSKGCGDDTLHKHNHHHHHQHMRHHLNHHAVRNRKDSLSEQAPCSPTESSIDTDTPMAVSPDPSIVAVHGSVMTNFPMPRGGKHVTKNDNKICIDIASTPVDNDTRKGSVSKEAEALKGYTGIPSISAINDKQEMDSGQEQGLKKEDNDAERTEKAKPIYKNDRIIAIDFDDVCSENMAAMIQQHNVHFATDLTLDDLQTYVLWQNRGWGTPADVARKVQTLGDLLPLTAPVPGFVEGVKELHELGHPMYIVTSRPKSDKQGIKEWLIKQGITIGSNPDDVIKETYFTGTYDENEDEFEKELNERLKQIWKEGAGKGKGGLGKLKILKQINASLFIDDHHGNLEPIIQSFEMKEYETQNEKPKIECLLFGEYNWNKSKSGLNSPVELMDYDQRKLQNLEIPFQKIEFGQKENCFRVKDWKELVEWVKEWDRQAVRSVCFDS
ncbi:uncharacterized protein L201_004297 [Kwoniella dendrophila CBS 6074]|uniref:Swiss Army Knife RNA repair protein HAD domain-containing protein n=1 Tax=Kwoniella dendrophila CBS 6074 TaxID=1295534 RepID=A0AAX4JWV2_9TREE